MEIRILTALERLRKILNWAQTFDPLHQQFVELQKKKKKRNGLRQIEILQPPTSFPNFASLFYTHDWLKICKLGRFAVR